MRKGTLYIVATPIGNLKDFSDRAKETLKIVDLILAEDTRVSKKLLNYFDIKKPIWKYNDYVSEHKLGEILKIIEKGQSVALLTDAGTPNISDPGYKIVHFLREKDSSIKIVPIPGPSALIAAISVSGINCNKFTFLGYPPSKKGRKNFFQNLTTISIKPIIIFESPHRLKKTLADLEFYLGGEKEIIIMRELTKIYEEIWQGIIKNANEYFQGEKEKGEFVIIIP